ncbi:programmed cell death protein 7 isoform X2 [Antennarius striatus]|uniref:programmed cell death protein 7 isoform X2 n=1 Tax=Antennarius striatus TaxID=241820 RepID=UPI0035ADE12B
MDAPFHRGPSEEPRPVYGDYLEAPPAAHRPPPPGSERDPSALLHTASRLTASQGYDGPPSDHRHGFPAPSPGGGGRGFGGHGFPFPYGFDPSVPPPPFGCPPPGPFPSMAPPAPLNSYGSTGAFPPTFSSGSQTAQYDRDPRQRHLHHGSPFGHPPQVSMEDSVQTAPRAEDGATLQRKQDRQWLRGFLRSRDRPSGASRSRQQGCSLPELRAALAGAAQLVSRLRESCDTLRREADNEGVWMDSYLLALEVKRQLDDKLADLHGSHLDIGKEKLSRVAKRRARQRRAGRRRQVEDSWREERVAEKEAVIDKWRMEQIRQVQEKKTEQELKLAADAVLCEVRKKQADVKRMQDVLRSLEKLRRLRKDAASRKGITTEPEHEEAFSSRLEQLRSVMKRRTAVYSAEENALMVMLEGEQEEERKREQERRAKKERERLLQKKQKTEAMLFGDELPVDPVLLPFREHHTQAEHSLQALLQIRRDWDRFVVAEDHPEGSSVPQDWVLPDVPSDHIWASALLTDDTE